MGKPREMSRTGLNPLGHYRKAARKNSFYDNNPTDNNNGAGASNSSTSSSSSSSSNSSGSNSSHHNSSNTTTSNRIAKVGKGILSRLGSYTSSKTSSSGSLGIKSPGRVKKRTYDSKGHHAPRKCVTIPHLYNISLFYKS